ncbi:MAG: transposase [Blastocatellales bacterium]|nr:transposase [Blastocatellales bacterium]
MNMIRRLSTGRPRNDRRLILNAIIHRLAQRRQWNHLPREFGDDSTIHRVFQHWVKLGIFAKIWAALVAECDELLNKSSGTGKPPTVGWAKPGWEAIVLAPIRTDREKRDEKEPAHRWRRGLLAIIIARLMSTITNC